MYDPEMTMGNGGSTFLLYVLMFIAVWRLCSGVQYLVARIREWFDERRSRQWMQYDMLRTLQAGVRDDQS